MRGRAGAVAKDVNNEHDLRYGSSHGLDGQTCELVAMAILRFPPAQVDLCASWFDTIETSDPWTEMGAIGEGESEAIRVTNHAGLNGVAKPGKPKTDGVCRAAHEKIAADLAHTLGLPVPPVVLWDRGNEHEANRYLSISAWAFPQAVKWDTAQKMGFLTADLIASAGPAVSAMLVFHTWISDTDRKSDHTQINVDSPEDELGTAFIDHAFSMSYVWKAADHPAGACPRYMPAPELPEIMTQTADRIAALAVEEVTRLVNRLPLAYLPQPQRGHILSNLVSRKARLRDILGLSSGG